MLKNEVTEILKTRRFDIIDSAVIISTVISFVLYRLVALLLITAESILSKHLVLRIIVALFFLLYLSSSYVYCNPNVVFF